MTDKLYVANGSILTRDGALRCGCCGGGGDDPPWVCPDCFPGGGPDGPGPPNNPDGTPRCCVGDTICSAVDDEPLFLGFQLNGSIGNRYTYGSGPNAGQTFEYSADWNEVFVEESGSAACSVTNAGFVNLTVPYVSENGDPSNPGNVTIQVRADRVTWNRNRGFFGDSADNGDDPVANTSSGIRLTVGSGAGPIRGTNNNGYSLENWVCRSRPPLAPIAPSSPRPNTFRLSIPPFVTLESGTEGQTTPSLVCLNKVVHEYTNTFTVNSGSDTNIISVVARIYAFVARVAPCPLTV